MDDMSIDNLTIETYRGVRIERDQFNPYRVCIPSGYRGIGELFGSLPGGPALRKRVIAKRGAEILWAGDMRFNDLAAARAHIDGVILDSGLAKAVKQYDPARLPELLKKYPVLSQVIA